MILFRLIRDKKVVGHEKHENGRIYHCNRMVNIKGIDPNWDNIFTTGCYIPHDRKDRYTEVKVGEQMLFERDEVLVNGERGIIKFGKYFTDFNVLHENIGFYYNAIGKKVNENYTCTISLPYLLTKKDIKIIGAIGVDDETDK